MKWPFPRKPKDDALKDAERETDDLKRELDQLRQRLLRDTVIKTVQGDDR